MSVLARLTARIEAPIVAGEEHVVIAWPLERDGRKRHAGSAVPSADGHVLAVARALSDRAATRDSAEFSPIEPIRSRSADTAPIELSGTPRMGRSLFAGGVRRRHVSAVGLRLSDRDEAREPNDDVVRFCLRR